MRTLFVVVTVFAVWLGWELSYIHQRKSMLSAVREGGGTVDPAWFWHAFNNNVTHGRRQPELKLAQISIIRLWLGDVAIGHLELPYDYDERELRRFQRAFPEAEVEIFRAEEH